MYSDLTTFTGSALYVQKEKWYRSDYFLTDGSSTYGKLWHEGTFHHKVKAESAVAAWEFREKGFLNRRLFIVDPGSGSEVASLKQAWTGGKGVLTLTEGREYHFEYRGFWRGDLVWADPLRGDVLTVRPKAFSRKSIVIEVHDPRNTHLALLSLLSVYFIDKMRRHAAVAT